MGHLSARDGYRRLADRLNRFPQGAPPSERLFSILEILKLPPAKQALASRQLRSRYLDRLLRENPHSSRTSTAAPS